MTSYPTTLGIRFLRDHGIPYVPHQYRYSGGGAKASAEALGVDPLRVAKTLIFEDDARQPLVVVINGPLEVSTKQLARERGCRSISPCAVARAEQVTGYKVGGISPFGQKTALPLHVQLDLFEHATIFVNGGLRGFLVEIAPDVLTEQLGALLVDVAQR